MRQASTNTSIFLSEAWLETWLEVYGDDFEGHWVHWEDSDVVVGGCLLVTRIVRRRFIPFRSLYFNASGEAIEGAPHAEFNEILCLPGYGDAVADDLAALLGEMSWDRLLVSGYEAGGVLERLVATFPGACVERDSRPAAYVDLASLSNEPFESSLSANTRYQIRRSRRLYEAKYGQIVISRAGSLDEAMDFLDELARLHGSRWRSKGEEGSFSRARYTDFHRRLIPRLWGKHGVDLIRVDAGETTIGYVYNFAASGKVNFFQSGLTYEADAKLKPGLLTHSLAIEFYRSRGLREYDFLAGDAQYKRSLAKKHRTLVWTTVFRDRAWIRFLLWIRRLWAGDPASTNPVVPRSQDRKALREN